MECHNEINGDPIAATQDEKGIGRDLLFFLIDHPGPNIDVMSSGKNGEDRCSINSDGREMLQEDAIMRHQDQQDGRDLQGSGHLTNPTGLNLRRIMGKNHHKDSQQNDHIPGDDDHCQPAGKHLDDGECDEPSREEQFVSNGVEISSQLCPLVGDPCDETVDPVGNACKCKYDERPRERLIDDQDDKKRD
jgi:hypothetical protein